MAALNDAERSDIQGNILRAYGFKFGRYTVLRIRDPAGARALLARLLEQKLILSAAGWDLLREAKPTSAINVAFTHEGLAAMGVAAEKLLTFPEAFRQGMAARADHLGDTGPNAPEHWVFGRDPAQSHVLLSVYGRTPEAKEAMLQRLLAELAAAGTALEVTHRLDVGELESGVEHFGYEDGAGQPVIEGSGAPEYPGGGTPAENGAWTPIKAGEFVLGHEREFGQKWNVPAPPLGHNGSFLVFRQLAQDVVGFRDFLRRQARAIYGADDSDRVEMLAAKLMGRWRSGCPLSLAPEKNDPSLWNDRNRNNDFRFAGDDRGAVCPIGSHIRRMNPRDGQVAGSVKSRRIIRRGLPYGPWLPEGSTDDGVERGLAFMAINASIAEQFEFLQRIWANDGEFAGLDRDEVDPFIGQRRTEQMDPITGAMRPGGVRFGFTPADGRERSFDLPRFVTLRGGGYFFIPSLSALKTLSAGNT